MNRAFTLIEAIAAIVIISLAAPPTFLLMRDVADARRSTVVSERALWLAAGVMEHIIADVESDAPGLGPAALENAADYLDDPASGLRVRLADMTSVYVSQGIAYDVAVSDPISADGTPTGNANEDVFRRITIHVTWSRRSSGDTTFALARLVAIR
jgi:prepilin-type N-terminal cleavage/methylation domain-containing protein